MEAPFPEHPWQRHSELPFQIALRAVRMMGLRDLMLMHLAKRDMLIPKIDGLVRSLLCQLPQNTREHSSLFLPAIRWCVRVVIQ